MELGMEYGIFRNFGKLMGGFSLQTKVPKFHELGVFLKKCFESIQCGQNWMFFFFFFLNIDMIVGNMCQK